MTKALIVDDDEFALKVLSARFKKFGIQTVIFQRGKEALQYLDGTDMPPEVIILDIIVPDINGFELLSEIRKRVKLDKSKVYVYSSLSSDADKQKAVEKGANGFFSKKFEGFEDLVNKISEDMGLKDTSVSTPPVTMPIEAVTPQKEEPQPEPIKTETPTESPKPILEKDFTSFGGRVIKRIAEKDAQEDQKGFTLIELLMVIAIIGLLVTIGVMSQGTIRERRNDDIRVNDLNLLHGAIRLMIVENSNVLNSFVGGSCPAAGVSSISDSSSGEQGIDGSGWIPIDFTDVDPPPLDRLPVDPINDTTYRYEFRVERVCAPSIKHYYELRALLENEGKKDQFARNDSGGDADEGDYYEVGNKTTLDIL